MTESPSAAAGMRRKPRQARSQERVNRILDVAEELFITQGYAATTTNAIASGAKVPIGSLYQFFPDKSAIMQAIALRHEENIHQKLAVLDNPELANLSLEVMVEQLIDITAQHFLDNPGYYAIFMELQSTIPELQAVGDVMDTQLMQDLASLLAKRVADLNTVNLETADYEAIAFIIVKAIGTLLWLSLSQEKTFQPRLVAETKRLALSYLQSYFPSDGSNATL